MSASRMSSSWGQADERLRVLYELSRQMAVASQVDEVLRFATRRVRELFNAEGCAILLLDENRREFRFPIASQRAGSAAREETLAELRFPADRGIAGWVAAQRQAVYVRDASQDPRFYSGVDAASGAHTASILCAPLQIESGVLGVLEVMNPQPQDLEPAAIEFLEVIASDFAVLYQKAELQERLRAEVLTLRQVGLIAAIGLLVAGAFLSGGALVVQLGRALSMWSTVRNPAFLVGVLLIASGVALFRALRRARAREPHPPGR